MKRRVLISTTILGLTSLCILTTGLSSCSRVSQWVMPILVGGEGSKSPWKDIDLNKNDNRDDIKTDKCNFTSPQTKYSDYLANSFINYTSNNQSTGYGYMQPYQLDNDGNGTSNRNDYGWYASTDSKLKYTHDEKYLTKDGEQTQKDVFTSVANANMAMSSTINCTIASSINSISNGFLKFLSQTGITSSNDDVARNWYASLFGGLNGVIDDKTSDTNKQFYEFIYGINNLLSSGKTTFKFGESSTQFYYDSSLFGPGPYISADKIGSFGTNDMPYVKDVYDHSDPTKYVIKDSYTKPNGVIPNIKSAYTIYDSDKNLNDWSWNDDSTQLLPTTFNMAVPFLINPGTMQYSYYNPSIKSGMNPNDYLLNDISPIQMKVSSSKDWDTFTKHVDSNTYQDKSKWVNNLSWSINCGNDISNNFFGWTANNTQDKNKDFYIAANDGKDDKNSAKYIDPILDQMFNGNDSVKSDSYVGFANYTFIGFPQKGDTNEDKVKYLYMPIFGGIASGTTSDKKTLPAIFPIGLLSTLDNNKNIDGSLLTADYLPAAQELLVNKKVNDNEINTPENKIYHLDLTKLVNKEEKFINFIDTANVDLNKNPADFVNEYNNKHKKENIDANQFLLLCKWLFGKDGGINVDEFIKPIH